MNPTELIKKYNITTLYQGGELKIQLHPVSKPTKEEIEEVIANKPAILAEFKARWEKDAEDDKHTHKVVIHGWEATTIYVDDREDLNTIINEEFEAHGEYLGCTREMIAEQITKALNIVIPDAELVEAKAIIAKAEKQTVIPTWEEEKANRKAYNDVMNEGGDGYVPHRITVEQVAWAKDIIAEKGLLSLNEMDMSTSTNW